MPEAASESRAVRATAPKPLAHWRSICRRESGAARKRLQCIEIPRWNQASFAVLATLLAAVGLYGVLAYSVAQRTREIGVRMALGASAGVVRGMVLRQVGMMALVGGVIGIAAAIALGRGAQSILYELKGWDPAVITTSALLLALVAMGAGLIPALRASRVDPMQALRYE